MIRSRFYYIVTHLSVRHVSDYNFLPVTMTSQRKTLETLSNKILSPENLLVNVTEEN